MPPEIIQDTPKIKQKILPNEFRIAFLIVLLASSLIFTFLPHIFSQDASQPPFVLYLCAGLIAVAFTSILLALLSRLGLGLGKNALILSLGYGTIVAMVKLVVAPFSLYEANRQTAFDSNFADPNDSAFYLVTAAIVLVLYLIVFTILYKNALMHVRRAGVGVKQRDNKLKFKGRYVVLVIGVIAIILYVTGYYIIPIILALPALNYFSYIFGTFGILIFIALMLAIFLAKVGFKIVEKQAVVTKNATLLASFFWIGVSLIFLYHVMWVIFMLALIQLWPFRTYSPK